MKHDIPYHSFHAFRHTFGTNLSRAGVSIETVCKLMGHSSVNVTAQYYIHIYAQRQNHLILDIETYAERYGNKAVRQNITLPAWLDTYVQKNHLSLSKIVQDSILSLAQTATKI